MASISDSKLETAFRILPETVKSNLDKVVLTGFMKKEKSFFTIDNSKYFDAYLPSLVKYTLAVTHPEYFQDSSPPQEFCITVLYASVDKEDNEIVCVVAVDDRHVLKFSADELRFKHDAFLMQRLKDELAKEENREFAKHFCLWDGSVKVFTEFADFWCICMPYYAYTLVDRLRNPSMVLPVDTFVRNMKSMGRLFDFFYRANLWHLDTYPRNIVLDSQDNFVLIDWDHGCYTGSCDSKFVEYVRKAQYESFYVCLKQCYLAYKENSESVQRDEMFRKRMAYDFPMKDEDGNDRTKEKEKWGKALEAQPFMKNRTFNRGVKYPAIMYTDQNYAGYIALCKNVIYKKGTADTDDFWSHFNDEDLANHDLMKKTIENVLNYPEKSESLKRKLEEIVDSPEY